jgi:hypothetical protein
MAEAVPAVTYSSLVVTVPTSWTLSIKAISNLVTNLSATSDHAGIRGPYRESN